MSMCVSLSLSHHFKYVPACGQERLWEWSTKSMRVDPADWSMFMTTPPLCSSDDRQAMARILFESLYVPRLFLANSAVLALLAHRKHSGVVIDCGYEQTQCIPIYKGRCLADAVRTMPFGGKDISDHLVKLLHAKGYDFRNYAKEQVVVHVLSTLSLSFMN